MDCGCEGVMVCAVHVRERGSTVCCNSNSCGDRQVRPCESCSPSRRIASGQVMSLALVEWVGGWGWDGGGLGSEGTDVPLRARGTCGMLSGWKWKRFACTVCCVAAARPAC